MNKKQKHLAMLALLEGCQYIYSKDPPLTGNVGDRWFDPSPKWHTYHVYRKYRDKHIYGTGSDYIDWIPVSSKEFYKNEN